MVKKIWIDITLKNIYELLINILECSTCLRYVKMKIIMKFNFISISIMKIWNRKSSADKHVGQLEASFTAGGNVKWLDLLWKPNLKILNTYLP